MEFHKKINLLPQGYKDRYVNKYLMFSFGSVLTVLVMILLTSLISLALVNHSISKLTVENKDYQSKQMTVSSLQASIDQKKKLVDEYEKDNFPFRAFINSIAEQKPEGLTVISVDSADRLLPTESVQENTPGSASSQETKENAPSSTATPAATPAPAKQIAYEKDLAGSKLIVRGYSANSSEIASFISNLSRLFYVADTQLTAIEEHTVNGTDKANIFEVVLTLK